MGRIIILSINRSIRRTFELREFFNPDDMLAQAQREVFVDWLLSIVPSMRQRGSGEIVEIYQDELP
jgi:hypothetical protein